MARIDRLDETPRQLLQTASVVGREVPLRLLAALWPQPADLPEQLRTLQNLEFLYEQAGREPGFVFKHALTQDVAYATLLEGRRRALHAAAGQALETLHAGRLEEVYDRLAYHYARTDDAAKAVRYLTGFADRAAGMHAHSDAARALEDALSHVAGLPTGERDQQLVATAVRLAASYYFLGRFRDTVELLEGSNWSTPGLVETRFSPDALVWVTVVFHGTAAWRNHGLIIFPLLLYRTSVQLCCPAAPPGGGLRPPCRPPVAWASPRRATRFAPRVPRAGQG